MLGGMDERLSPAPVVAPFAAAVRPVAGVLAFYAGGSLATGDFRPGISDLDLVAIVARPMSPAARGDLLAGLTTVSRADATIGDGVLITKREAIARLPRLGVPDHLAAEIAARRAGRTVTHTDESRQARAVLARRLMRENLVRLLR
jgi:hypothetical protein